MTALDRAVALAEDEDVAVGVGDELHLDVARALEVALAEHRAVAERGLRLAARRRERRIELGRGADDPHAPPASTGCRLDDEREADLFRIPLRQRPARPLSRRCAWPRACRRRAAERRAAGRPSVKPAFSTAAAKSAFSARKP